MKLDREITTIMKGYGILIVALHNLLHLGSITNFVHENEFTFSAQRTWNYIDVIRSFDLSDIGQFFSFMGPIVLPLFISISGYGLVKKYENTNDFNIGGYIFSSWKKLALLLLPATLFYIVLSVIVGNWGSVVPKTLFQLTLLNNFSIPLIKFKPGVYWYFGLTFELYLLFALVRRWNVKQLLLLLCGMLVVQVLCNLLLGGPTSDIWIWVKHNFIGWGQLFLIGMIAAKTNVDKYLPSNSIVLLLLVVICLCLFLFLQLNVWTWLLVVPFVALLFNVFLSGAVYNTIFLKKVCVWFGNISSFIFVAHPIARSVVIIIHKSVDMPLWVMTLFYTVLFIVAAIIYKHVYHWLMKKI